jgi:hypothetical protein
LVQLTIIALNFGKIEIETKSLNTNTRHLAAILLNVLVSYFLSNYVRFFTVFKAGGKILPFQGFWACGHKKKTSRNGTRVFLREQKQQKWP